VLSLFKDHPNFVRVLDFVQQAGAIKLRTDEGSLEITQASFMTMELSAYGDLFELVHATQGLKCISLVRHLLQQLLSAVSHLHQQGFAHLDIKPENVLIGDDLRLKLCDFGFAQSLRSPLTIQCGSISYMSPEVLTKEAYQTYEGVQADIYSLGVVAFVLYFGQLPFARADDKNYNRFVSNPSAFFRLHPAVKKLRNSGVQNLDSDFVDLLQTMMAQEPRKRSNSVD
jgi:serine/threonine protein kinase